MNRSRKKIFTEFLEKQLWNKRKILSGSWKSGDFSGFSACLVSGWPGGEKERANTGWCKRMIGKFHLKTVQIRKFFSKKTTSKSNPSDVPEEIRNHPLRRISPQTAAIPRRKMSPSDTSRGLPPPGSSFLGGKMVRDGRRRRRPRPSRRFERVCVRKSGKE